MATSHFVPSQVEIDPTLTFFVEGTRVQPQAREQEGTILLVDAVDLNRRLMRGILKNEKYKIIEASRASGAFELLDREQVDLIILDLVLPEIGGTEFCRRLRGNPQTQLIPTLMLTSIRGIENEVAGLSSGADEFLVKPLHPAVVRARVGTMLRHKALIDNLDAAESILFVLAEAVEQRDKGTGEHCRRLAGLSEMMGRSLGLTPAHLEVLRRGAYLHDIGKLCIPDAILLKAGRLTDAEWKIMREHTIKGESICRPLRSLAPVLPIIRSHHERWDGSGYPDGLQGDKIPLFARILQLADIYDALTSARSYKLGFTREQALATLAEEVRRGWRDPALVEHFCSLMMQAPQTAPAPCLLAPVQESLGNMIRHINA